MKKLWFLLLTLLIFAISAMPAFAADEPSLTTFEVKYELSMFDDGILLFSEEPVEILKGEQYYGGKAYVFPIGTKVVQMIDGEFIPTYIMSETGFETKNFFRLTNEAIETVLTGAMAGDEKGVRIVSTNMGRGLLTVMVSGVELPTMTVKTEIPMWDGTVLLFSEKPVRTQWNKTDFPYDISFVFPQGTKIAQKLNGVWIPIYAASEYDAINRIVPFTYYGDPVFELELTEEMGVEKYGVRICSTYFGRGLLPVLIDGVSEYAVNPENSLIYAREMESYTQKATDEVSLAYLRQPSRDVQSDDPEIITLSDTITAGISSEYEKARAIHDWVSGNIWYDSDSLAGISSVEMLPGEERWYSTVVLRNKRGICSGYANLTAALLRAAGIPAKAMSGFAGGAHGWTVVFVEGRWINMDTTWDSKNYYQNGEFSSQQASDNKYFDMSDSEFAKDHTVFYYADYILKNQLAIIEPDPEPESTELLDNNVITTIMAEVHEDAGTVSNMTIIIIVIVAIILVISGVVIFTVKKKK